jgi:hypothetical protein
MTAKRLQQWSTCAMPQNGVNVINNVVGYTDALTACSETNANWQLMDITETNFPDLANVLGNCTGSQDAQVWVRSVLGLGVPQVLATGVPCGYVDVQTGADGPMYLNYFAVFNDDTNCNGLGQFVACSQGPEASTSTGTWGPPVPSTTIQTQTSTTVLPTTTTVETLINTTTATSTLLTTVTVTATVPSFTASVSIVTA